MAKLISLGLSSIPAPARPAKPQLDAREMGTTGTPMFGGYVRDLGEYNSELSGISAFSTYEKMRRGDAQVAATLAAIKLPIRGAEWVVREPKNATPIEREATKFVHDELFERDVEWGAALDNALLMLDFGCVAHEDVWYVEGGRVHLAKVAPRLPLTFSRWIVDQATENLIALEQYGAKGDTYVTVQVPAEKLAVFTFQQEGANFVGRSLLRPMYGHWYVKQQLYRIDAIAQERNGLGVPTMIMGEGATKEDIATAKTFLESLTAHQKLGVLLPHGWQFTVSGTTGAVRDAKESISHHNVQMSKAALAQFLDLGQSESGNRALGQSMSDFFMLALEALAGNVARVMNWTTITRLVDYNFQGVRRYPELVPQQILAMRFETLVQALEGLAGARMIEPDDRLEEWLRAKMALPQKDPKTARKVTVAPPAAPGARA